MTKLIKVTTTENEGLFFNADLIRVIVPPTSGKAYALIYLQGTEKDIEIPSSEWQRIEPLLTGEQVEVPTAPTHSKALLDAVRDLSLFADELKVRQQNVTGYRDALPYSYYQVTKSYDLGVDGLMFQARKVAEMMHAAPQAPSLPANVLDAWRTYDDASWKALTDLDTPAATEQASEDAKAMFLTLFGDFVKSLEVSS